MQNGFYNFVTLTLILIANRTTNWKSGGSMLDTPILVSTSPPPKSPSCQRLAQADIPEDSSAVSASSHMPYCLPTRPFPQLALQPPGAWVVSEVSGATLEMPRRCPPALQPRKRPSTCKGGTGFLCTYADIPSYGRVPIEGSTRPGPRAGSPTLLLHANHFPKTPGAYVDGRTLRLQFKYLPRYLGT